VVDKGGDRLECSSIEGSPRPRTAAGAAGMTAMSRQAVGLAAAGCVIVGLTGCGGASSRATVPRTPTPAPVEAVTPSATPASGITIALSGDTSLTITAPAWRCGPVVATTGVMGWAAATNGPPGFAVSVSNYLGPATYLLTREAPNFAVFVRLASANDQTIATTSGIITIGADGQHAHISATGGFTVPPDYSTTTGTVQMDVVIAC
jgi:hypothetical protein